MKTIRLIATCIILLPFTFLCAQSTLSVEITGMENNKGDSYPVPCFRFHHESTGWHTARASDS